MHCVYRSGDMRFEKRPSLRLSGTTYPTPERLTTQGIRIYTYPVRQSYEPYKCPYISDKVTERNDSNDPKK